MKKSTNVLSKIVIWMNLTYIKFTSVKRSVCGSSAISIRNLDLQFSSVISRNENFFYKSKSFESQESKSKPDLHRSLSYIQERWNGGWNEIDKKEYNNKRTFSPKKELIFFFFFCKQRSLLKSEFTTGTI